MAEEITNSFVIPEISKPKGGNARRHYTGKPNPPNSGKDVLPLHRRASIGPAHNGGNSRRSSIGNLSSPNSLHNVLPRYLRASTTGSCHDFCKYGKEQEFEVKTRRSIPKRIITPPSGRGDSRVDVGPADRKNSMVGKFKPSDVSRSDFPETPEIIKRVIPSPSKKVEVVTKNASPNDEKVTENEGKKMIDLYTKNNPSLKSKVVTVKPLPSIKISKKETSKTTVKKLVGRPSASLTPKPSVNKVMSLHTKKSRTLNVSPLKDQNRVRKSETKQLNNDMVQEKTLHVIKIENENRTIESAQNAAIVMPPSPLLSSPIFSSYPNAPSLSSEEEEEEDLEESEYTDGEADDFISETDGSVKMMSRKAGVILSEDKESGPMKIKFRRGKIVDVPSENNGPRRLKFRRGRVSGENQDTKGNSRRRSFKKREIDDDINSSNPGSEKVVLRHQDLQGKKDGQGLFNNVIEETASKLVETRKSKVKALVGAFETVISLQESPSTPIVS